MASSGDLLADRRFAYAEGSFEEGDFAAAADLARQVLEIAPGFAPAWFLLGKSLVQQGEDAAAADAFRAALLGDPDDAVGARLQLARLGEAEPGGAMSPAYVRGLFDEYAIRFDRHLRQSLQYRGPELLFDAVRRACSLRLRPFTFDVALDLGCGSGLAAELFRPVCRHLAGVDLSPAMVKRAAGKKLYDELAVDDLTSWLSARPSGTADLVLAADVFVYLADLRSVFSGVSASLQPGGLFAFTVQAHPGEGVVLGEDQRFAHGEPNLRDCATEAGLTPVLLEPCTTRQDRGVDVPGTLVVAAR